MDEFFARNRLSAYLDGELTTDETREVEEALARSPELRAELDALRAAVKLLRAGGPVPAPRDFARALERRLQREPMAVGWRRHLARIRPEVALLAAAAAIVLVYVGRRPEPVAPEGEAVAQVDDAAANGTGPADGDAALDPAADDAPADAPEAGTLDEGAVADARPGVAGTPAVDAAGMPGLDRADGVLGGARGGARTPSKTPPSATRKAQKGAVEKEAYAPAWESTPEVATPPTVQAPARYRLSLTTETGLRDLDAVVRRYGGQLQDERGRPLAPYPMEAGDARRVRLSIPAGTVSSAQLYADLQALGHAELTQADTLYGGGAAPIVVEVRRE